MAYYPNYYNPSFASFQQPAPQMPQMQTMPQMQNQQSGINWVQGEAGAKAFPVAPGASVLLMDSESKTMYLKGADQSGMPTMRIFDYTERTAAPSVDNLEAPKYVTYEEFGKLVKAVRAMKDKMEVSDNEQSDL